MCWRVPGGKLWEKRTATTNKRAFKRLITTGKARGCVAFADEQPAQPVGWCSLGPRADFIRLQNSRVRRTAWDEQTWSVACFYVSARWRGRGVASGLLKAAVQLARAEGANKLEGYPVKPQHSGKPVPAAFAWTGVPVLFQRQSFRPVLPPGATHPVYIKTLRKSPSHATEPPQSFR